MKAAVRTGPKRVLRIGALLLPFTIAACAGVMRSYDIAPNGLTRTEDQWRHMLAAGRGDSMAHQIARGEHAPGDELLRLLYLGAAAHYAADYDRSNEYLEAAAVTSDDRITKSLSRSVLSIISNDGVLPYAPAPTERLLIPYYAALNYIALGRMEDAAVEARRIATLLQNETVNATGDARALRAALRSFTGAVFEATGNRNDALVAYRNAAALGATVDTTRIGPKNGTVIVMLEDGFVAHRVEQNLYVWLGVDEVHAFRDDNDDGRASTATSVAARVMQHAFAPGRRLDGTADIRIPLSPEQQARRTRQVCRTERVAPVTAADSARASGGRVERRVCEEHEETPYLLKVAWPVYRWAPSPVGFAIVTIGSDTVANTRFVDVSGAVYADYQKHLPLIVARTVARGAAKAALTQGAKNKAEEKSEGLGKLIGILGNAGNVLLERADTRSWHVLPGRIAIVRLQVPAGPQNVTVALPGLRTLDLGSLQVDAGRTVFVSRRAW